jgi:predicted aconitase with swiveling domain
MKGRVLNAGEAWGPLLVLEEPLSFWGAFDPKTGEIIDTHHPQKGLRLGGHIVLMSETRGSGSAPGAIAEAIRRGTAPLGIVLGKPDVNLAIGASVAAMLYGHVCPIISAPADTYEVLKTMAGIAIKSDGTLIPLVADALREPRQADAAAALPRGS